MMRLRHARELRKQAFRAATASSDESRRSDAVESIVFDIAGNPEPGHIESGKEQQGQDGSDDDAAHHGVGHRSPEHLLRWGSTPGSQRRPSA